MSWAKSETEVEEGKKKVEVAKQRRRCGLEE